MHFDASRSLAELELRPRPVEESLRDAIAWFREMSWIESKVAAHLPLRESFGPR